MKMMGPVEIPQKAFLIALYSDSEKFPKTTEIKFARGIRNIYTHDKNDKVINFDFKPINDNQYCEPYIALNADIDKYEYKKYVRKTEQYNKKLKIILSWKPHLYIKMTLYLLIYFILSMEAKLCLHK